LDRENKKEKKEQNFDYLNRWNYTENQSKIKPQTDPKKLKPLSSDRISDHFFKTESNRNRTAKVNFITYLFFY